MVRIATSIITSIALAAACGAGCAFEEGNPWGVARFAVEVVFDTAGREADGVYRTNDDYLVEVLELELELSTVALAIGGGETLNFDPAAPPPGYSLCHAEHCHADDGRLVPYEEVELELNAGTSSDVQITQAIDSTILVGATPVAAPLGVCTDNCELPLGNLRSVTVQPRTVTYELRVEDQRSGEQRRLPDEGIVLSGSADLSEPLTTIVAGRLGGREPPVVEISAQLSLAATLFDGLDWQSASLAEELALAFQANTSLEAAIQRTDF